MTWTRLPLAAVIAVLGGFVATALRAEPGVPPQELKRQANDAAIARGLEWLLEQQDADGAWRSATYSQLNAGPAATALATATLAHLVSVESLAPASREAARRDLDKSLAYLLGRLDATGRLRSVEGAGEYPNYATALTLIAFNRLPPAERLAHADAVRRMQAYLEGTQVTAPLPNKIAMASDVGGWGLVGGDPADVSSFRTANVSTTRYALSALASAEGDRAATSQRALQFLAGRQQADGGFAFLSDPLDQLNKAGAVDPAVEGEPFVARSYGTATADGLLALRAAGVVADDARVTAAIGWLDAHPQLEQVPGFPSDEVSTAAAQGLFYYYAAALADCMGAYPRAEFAARAPEWAAELVARQRADGSWANTIPTMREDDPLTATCLALEALGRLTAMDVEED